MFLVFLYDSARKQIIFFLHVIKWIDQVFDNDVISMDKLIDSYFRYLIIQQTLWREKLVRKRNTAELNIHA